MNRQAGLDGLADLVNENPRDFETREIIADYLEEQGDPTARAWRLLNEHRRVPEGWSDGSWLFWFAEPPEEHTLGDVGEQFKQHYASHGVGREPRGAPSAFLALQTAARLITEMLAEGKELDFKTWRTVKAPEEPQVVTQIRRKITKPDRQSRR